MKLIMLIIVCLVLFILYHTFSNNNIIPTEKTMNKTENNVIDFASASEKCT